jgi:two-component system LytT family sensor kinase
MSARRDSRAEEIGEELRRVEPPSGAPESGWPGKRVLLAVFAIWTLFGVYTAANWIFSPTGGRAPNPEGLLASAFFTAYLWALLTPGVFRLAARLNPEHGHRLARVLSLLLIGLAVGGLVSALESLAFSRLVIMPRRPAESWWSRSWDMSRAFLPKEMVTSFLLLGVGLGTDFSRRYRARQREAIQLQAERAALEARAAQLQAQSADLNAQLAEARLTALRSQLNPHFLFNTLNAVSALVTEDPRGVQDMIALLSELLRYALKESHEHETTVQEELRLLQIYLEILEIRYQGQLRIAIAGDHDVREALVPNLILQPLVENAVKHGTDRAGGHGTIDVRAYRSVDQLVLSVQDSGPGSDATLPAGQGGVGLRLTRDRLSELYGTHQSLELEPVPGGGMIARILLPYHTGADVRMAEDPAVRGI